MDKYRLKMDSYRKKYQLCFQEQNDSENLADNQSTLSKIFNAQLQIVEASSITLISQSSPKMLPEVAKPNHIVGKFVSSFDMISANSIPIKKNGKQIIFDSLDGDCRDSLLSIENKLNSTTKFQQSARDYYITIKKQKLLQFFNLFKKLKYYLQYELQEINKRIKQQVKDTQKIMTQHVKYLQAHFERQLHSKALEIQQLKNLIKQKNMLVAQSSNLIEYYQKQLNLKVKELADLKLKIIKQIDKPNLQPSKHEKRQQNQMSFGTKKQIHILKSQEIKFGSSKQVFNDISNKYKLKLLSPNGSSKNIFSESALKNKNEKILEIEKLKNKLNCLKLDIANNGMQQK